MKTTAREEYGKVQNDCTELTKMIVEKIEKEASKDRNENINWGHVGSLQHTRQLLKEILFFLGDSTDEDEFYKAIETELEKAR